MAKYARFRSLVELSDTSDYADDSTVELTDTWTPDEWVRDTLFETTSTSATTYTTSHLSTLSKVAIYNTDSTNFVTITFRTGANSSTDNKIALAAGKYIELTDVTASGNLIFTADTAAVIVRITLIGT